MRRLPNKQRAQILVLGNKHQFGIDWKNRFQGFDFLQGSMDERVISSATLHYHLILCLDPVLYARHLQRINLPIIMAATTKEIHDYPEILDVTDYLLPVPGSRHDVALRQLIAEQILIGDKKDSEGKESGGGNEAKESSDASQNLTSTAMTSADAGKEDGGVGEAVTEAAAQLLQDDASAAATVGDGDAAHMQELSKDAAGKVETAGIEEKSTVADASSVPGVSPTSANETSPKEEAKPAEVPKAEEENAKAKLAEGPEEPPEVANAQQHKDEAKAAEAPNDEAKNEEAKPAAVPKGQEPKKEDQPAE